MYVFVLQYFDLIVANSRERSIKWVCSRRVTRTEEAWCTVHRGLPHGFLCEQHLPDMILHLGYLMSALHTVSYASLVNPR